MSTVITSCCAIEIILTFIPNIIKHFLCLLCMYVSVTLLSPNHYILICNIINVLYKYVTGPVTTWLIFAGLVPYSCYVLNHVYVIGFAKTLHVSMQILRNLKSHNSDTVSCNTTTICISFDQLFSYILM